MPVNMRDRDGNAVVVKDEDVAGALSQGFHTETTGEQAGRVASDVRQDVYGGVGGKAFALGAGALRGATFGLSDAALGALGGDDTREDLSALKQVNPVTSTLGEIAGGIAPSLAAPGSLLARTPAGLASRIGASGFEAAAGQGLVRGAATAATAAGVEGALQSGGTYISDVALGDRELTAEGLAGALGHGFAFGAAGGAAIHGIERGTMAARRLFARPAESGERAAAAANDEWERQSQAAIDANDAAADAARTKLEAARVAREQASVARDQAGAAVAEEHAAAAVTGKRVGGPDEDRFVIDTGDGTTREVNREELQQFVRGQLPDNFNQGKLRERDGFTIQHGLPDPGTAAADNTLYVVKPSELTSRGVLAPQWEEGTVVANRDRILKGWEKGQKTGPMKIGWGPNGEVMIEANEPTLRAAAQLDQPVVVEVARDPDLRWPEHVRAKMKDITDTVTAETTGAAERRGLDAMKKRVRAGEIAEETGPFNEAGIEAAAKRQLERERAPGGGASAEETKLANAVKEYDEAKAAMETAQRRAESSAVPSYKSIVRRTKKKGVDEIDDVISAQELADRGWYEPPGGGADATRVAKARGAIKEGQRDPIRLAVSPSGKVVVVDGRHRLAAAIESGADVKVRWSAGYEPAADNVLRGQGEQVARGLTPEPSGGSLLDQLQATKNQIDAGADLGTLARQRTASPVSPKQLEQQYEEAVDRAENATDAAERQMHRTRAADIEKQLDAARAGGLAAQLADVAPHMTRYERASAELAEALGVDAPPAASQAAKEFRDAEATAERKYMARITRAVDDTAKMPSGLNKARAAKAEADAALARAKAAETEARIGARAAQKTADDTRKAFEAARPAVPEPEESLLGQLAGMPEAHAIPVLGPMLSRFSQSKVMQALASRVTGRVPATATTKAAALAAKTRDKIAGAIDRSLGLVERGVRAARVPALPAANDLAAALSKRAFDDGHPDAAKGATITQVAAVRMREVAYAATNPDVIVDQVRRETRDIHDPDLLDALEKHQIAKYQWLNDQAPKQPAPNPLNPIPYEPSPAAAMRWARQYAVANDPTIAFDALSNGRLTIEEAQTVRALFGRLFVEAQERMLSRAIDLKWSVPYEMRGRASILFGVPLERSMEPEHAAVLQSVYAPQPAPAPGAPTSPPQSSIANSTNLTALYQPASDRRASAMR